MITVSEMQANRMLDIEITLGVIEKKILQSEERGQRNTTHYLAPNDPIDAIIKELVAHGFGVTVELDGDPRDTPVKYLDINWE